MVLCSNSLYFQKIGTYDKHIIFVKGTWTRKMNEEQNLKNIMLKMPDSDFPDFSTTRGEISYIDRYKSIETALQPDHISVEKGALASSLREYIQELNGLNDEVDLKEALSKIPFVYLNDHGPGHIEKVIERVSQMLVCIDEINLSAYEVFILLCAIQIHDVGNVFGRKDHEKNLQKISQEKCSPYIIDTAERKLIEKIAATHGGNYKGNKDTISCLPKETIMKEKKVRCRLLASLLRFADEIADDSTRADINGIKNKTVPKESELYHYYSMALHTVKVEKDNTTSEIYLQLVYEFDSDIALKLFDKFGDKVYLLDEIYERVRKMETERRYCMRFLKPNHSIEKIKIEINISDSNDIFKFEQVKYELEEKGYPSVDIIGEIYDGNITGEELKNKFSRG